MGLLFRNWLEEGYYEEDEMGDLTKIEDPRQIREAANKGTLFHHDGMGMTKSYGLEESYKAPEKEYAVYEKEPAHQNMPNGIILGPFKSREEAEETRKKYGYSGDNYYVDELIQ
jgi:hypothetical protein